MNELLIDAGLELVVTILIGLLSIATVFVSKYFDELTQKAKSEIAKIDDEKSRAIASHAVDVVRMVVSDTVTATEQTTAKALRQAKQTAIQAKQDDEVDKLAAQLEELSRTALQDIKRTLDTSTIEALTLLVDDVDAYIENLIESKVYELKQDYNVLEISQSEIGFIK